MQTDVCISSSGLSPTQYQYTGQYSHTADFGLMFYNARWYDPTLGRFAQADSIVPPGVQGLDRYAYVNNNPMRYTDPTGHMCSDPDAKNRTCDGSGNPNLPKPKSPTGSGNSHRNNVTLNYIGYSSWEKQVLNKLYADGGPNAVYGVNFILENDIHITAGSGWQSGGGTRGAWYKGNNLVVLNSEAGYSVNSMPDSWGLSLVIHETRHIEQGKNIASSKFGEMDAWQIGIDVAENLGYYDKAGWTNRDLDVKYSKTVDDFSNAIQNNDPGYWNALTEWLPSSITNKICFGLCILPTYPSNIVLSQ